METGTGKRRKTKERAEYFDYNMLAVLVFLICFGLVMLYSSSSYNALVDYGDSMYYFKRQIRFCAAGFLVMAVAARIDYHKYIPWAKVLYFISVALMMLVQTSLGKEAGGARRWIGLPLGLQFQPSEMAKIAVILFIPALIVRMGRDVQKLAGIGKVFLWGGANALCVYKFTENLSTAVIVMGICCVLIFMMHPKTAPFIAMAAAGAAAVVAAVRIFADRITETDDFRLQRIIVWLDPERYASDEGYQTLQGLYAIGSGGFFGKGLGNSVQKTIIPEVQNDMILSVICEELGVFGVIIVLLLFGMLLYRLLFIAQNAPDMYGALVVTGIFSHIALQVILNVSVVTNLIPTTGITLPFISYGGTSTLFLMVEMGIALNVSRNIKIKE